VTARFAPETTDAIWNSTQTANASLFHLKQTRPGYRLRFFLSVLLFCIAAIQPCISKAMNIEDVDASRRTDWARAGYPGGIPAVDDNIITVTDHGVTGDGATDDAGAVQTLIDEASTPAVLYFPAGAYRLESSLTLKSGVVLRGAGSNATHLVLSSDTGGIDVEGRTDGAYVPIQSGFEKGATEIVVDDASGFEAGRGGMIRQEDIDAVDPSGEWAESSWVPDHVVGQMVRIVAVDGNTLTVDPPLNITFSPDKHPEIRPVDYIENVGIEDLHIQCLDTGSTVNTINMDYAARCWIRWVESDFTQKYHISISRSLHLEIRECYIHDAYHKGGGGQGYGTSLSTYATAILVENNIFDELRHAMIIQMGGNGCVFGYNYAQRNYSDDGWDKTYISVHGHYPYMNLFEGNIVGYIGLADYWGASGPGNTLFRNRVIGTDRHEDFGPYRGITVDDYSHKQNIIGNELTGDETGITFDGHENSALGTSEDILLHGNNIHGAITWDASIDDRELPPSFYLPEKPAFFGGMAWPSLGGDMVLGTGTIPARERFDRGEYVPQPDASDPPDEDDPSGEEGEDEDSGTEPSESEDLSEDDEPSGDGGSGGCFISVLFSGG
jgi:hypothetical protein